ncbi:MAG: prephenate dehydrogenase [Ruminococcaceae bacterium]|nr:prephenate dehydrogenase [Oscillospiraceae bacterium]
MKERAERQTGSLTVGIVGLGLIGGSMARAYRAADHRVLATDLNTRAIASACDEGVINGILDRTTLPECDLLLLAVYPAAATACLSDWADAIKKSTVVLDLCGTKRRVCDTCFAIAQEHGFDFVGGHPMAGTQFSGFESSRADLFKGAPMVLVMPPEARSDLKERVITLLSPIGFGSFSDTTAAAHDRVIAFTSQLAHVVSNAYVKSPQAQIHHGFSAGSYRDLTRVAWLNEAMWCELFLENRDYLSDEIDGIIRALTEYKEALDSEDAARLKALLREGRIAKENADKGDPS